MNMISEVELKTWSPLIKDGLLKDKIRKILEDFSVRLMEHKHTDNGAFTGDAGISLYFAYMAVFFQNEVYRDKSIALIDSSLDSTVNPELHYTDTTGILWAFKHLVDIGIIEANIDEFMDDEMEMQIIDRSIADLKIGHYDYLYGGISPVPYLLERRNKKIISAKFPEIISALIASADRNENGISWQNKFLIPKDIKVDGKLFNLGIAHGIPAIIIILSELVKAGVKPDKTSMLLTESISWILNLKGKDSDPFLFATHHPKQGRYSRLAWCYGDLSIAITLLRAALNTGNDEWLNKAIEIGLHSAKRMEYTTTIILDTEFCHGSIGVAHIFNRFYHYTHKKEFKTAALFWYEQTLEIASKMGHFKMYKKLIDEKEKPDWHDTDSLLEGIAGIGLGLMAAISDVEPKWDKLLLLS
jgi:lantibiotic modifying enzyme